MKNFKKIVLSAALAASMLVGFGATSLVKPAAAEKDLTITSPITIPGRKRLPPVKNGYRKPIKRAWFY